MLIVGKRSCAICQYESTHDFIGSKNLHCPTRVPHRYNMMGAFHVTDTWAERVKGKVDCRVRLDMIDLLTPSWWSAKGTYMQSRRPDFVTKALIRNCSTCGLTSKQRYAQGWMCLNEKCPSFSTSSPNSDRVPGKRLKTHLQTWAGSGGQQMIACLGELEQQLS